MLSDVSVDVSVDVNVDVNVEVDVNVIVNVNSDVNITIEVNVSASEPESSRDEISPLVEDLCWVLTFSEGAETLSKSPV